MTPVTGHVSPPHHAGLATHLLLRRALHAAWVVHVAFGATSAGGGLSECCSCHCNRKRGGESECLHRHGVLLQTDQFDRSWAERHRDRYRSSFCGGQPQLASSCLLPALRLASESTPDKEKATLEGAARSLGRKRPYQGSRIATPSRSCNAHLNWCDATNNARSPISAHSCRVSPCWRHGNELRDTDR